MEAAFVGRCGKIGRSTEEGNQKVGGGGFLKGLATRIDYGN